MTRLEQIARKHYDSVVDAGVLMDAAMESALREWTEMCAETAAKQYVLKGGSWGDLTAAVAAIRAMAKEEV